MWPASSGMGVVYHPTPIDPAAIGRLVHRHRVTVLVATPTFLQNYMRRCTREEFASLNLVITGAEKLPERLTMEFEEKYGVRPMEGYGPTECSPVVAANRPFALAPGVPPTPLQHGKIGLPVPGLAVRVVDPGTWEELPPGKPGLLLVHGPNVMQGYLDRPDLTAQAMHDGWYVTGDIVTQDENGLLEITDRLSRFSKIGGEMIPHLKVEEVLQRLSNASEPSFVVTGIPDRRKGERLVAIHTLSDENLRECLEGLRDSALPNLWKPRPQHFYHIDALPYLGTGKLDLRQIRELAMRMSREE
jgi:acyl-[acyl-carrier-protein]-phospholipid O-acyltransferase/long-chain-fatty-acid--[acyl-carrier-protein] ligase